MTWIKDANKIGKYEETRHGFRVYCIKASKVVEHITPEYIIRDLIPGEYVAINQSGVRIKATGRLRMHEKLHSHCVWGIDQSEQPIHAENQNNDDPRN